MTRVIRKLCEHGERSDEGEAVSNGSRKELSKVQDDCNIQEERLDEANGSVVFICQGWAGQISDKQHKDVDFLTNLSMEIAS